MTLLKTLFLGSLLLIFLNLQAGEQMTNLDIIKSTYESDTPQQNSENLKRNSVDDLSWTEAAGSPLAGTYIGFDQIAENVFARLATEWIDFQFKIDDYLEDGNKVIAYGTYSGTNKLTNKSFEARVAHLWKLDDGKIVSFEQFVDSVPMVDANR